jgi:hypothetical protein
MRSSLLGITTRNASQLVDDVVSREGAQHPHLPPAPLFGSRSLWGVAAGSQVFMPRPASSIHGSPLAWPPLDFSACAALIIAVFGRSFRLRPYADERHRTVATRAFGQFRRGRSDIAAVTRCRAFGWVAPAVLQTRPSGQIPSLRIARVPQPCARPLPSPASGRSSGLRPPAAVPGRGHNVLHRGGRKRLFAGLARLVARQLSTPSAMNRACHRCTTGFHLPIGA